MLINVLLTAAALLFLAGVVLWSVFLRRLSKTRIRFITVLVSLVLSIVATVVLKTVFPMYTENILAWIGAKLNPAFMELLQAVPSLCQIVLGATSGMLTPIAFFVIFMTLNFLSFIIYLFITLIMGARTKKKAKDDDDESPREAPVSKVWSLVLSLVQGLIILAVCLIPLASYSSIAPIVVTSVSEAEILPEQVQTTVDNVMDSYIKPIDDNAVVNVFRLFGGSLLTDSMTDFQVGTHTVHINDEIETLTDLVCHAVVLTQNNFADYDSKEEEALLVIAESFGKSEILPTVAGELVYGATDAWMNGEKFVGIDSSFVYIDKSGTFEGFIDMLLEVMHNDSAPGNEQALCNDLTTTAKILNIMIRSDLFKHLGDSEAMMDALSEPGVISGIVVELESNESMSEKLVPEIVNIGLRIVAKSLGVEAHVESVYDDMLRSIAANLNSSKTKNDEAELAAVTEAVTKAMDDAGVPVDAEMVESYAAIMIAELVDTNPAGEVTINDVKAFFALYAKETEKSTAPEGEQAFAGNHTTALFGTTAEADWREVLKGTKYEGMSDEELAACGPAVLGRVHVTLSAVSATNDEEERRSIREEAARILCEEYAGYGTMSESAQESLATAVSTLNILPDQVAVAASISSPDTMITQLITLDMLLLDGREAGTKDADTIARDAAAIEKVFQTAREILAVTSDSKELNLEELASSVGMILDEIGATSLFGQEKSAALFTAVIQSDTVREKADLDMTTATLLAQKGSTGDNLSYQQTFVTISQTVTTMENMNKNNGELTEKDIESLIRNINPQSAAMMEVYITADRLTGSYRVPARYSTTAAPLLSNAFHYMADADMSDEEYAKEALAINNVMTLLMAARDNVQSSSSRTLFGKKGILGKDAVDAVDDLMSSQSLAYSLRQTEFENDPFELSGLMKQTDDTDERKELENAIRWHYEEFHDEETYITLSLMAKLFGLGNIDDILAA